MSSFFMSYVFKRCKHHFCFLKRPIFRIEMVLLFASSINIFRVALELIVICGFNRVVKFWQYSWRWNAVKGFFCYISMASWNDRCVFLSFT